MRVVTAQSLLETLCDMKADDQLSYLCKDECYQGSLPRSQGCETYELSRTYLVCRSEAKGQGSRTKLKEEKKARDVSVETVKNKKIA